MDFVFLIRLFIFYKLSKHHLNLSLYLIHLKIIYHLSNNLVIDQKQMSIVNSNQKMKVLYFL